MSGPEYFTSDNSESRLEILQRLKQRAEAGFGPAQIILNNLKETAAEQGMAVDDYIEMGDRFEEVIDQDEF